MRILIVEDEKRLAGTLQELLHRQGYTADVCYDGISGLDNARSDIYDLLVLDAMLPGMDGFTLLRQLRQRGSRLPVLMLTARSELNDRVRGLDAGADYYLTKPFEPEELLACIRSLLRRGGEDYGLRLRELRLSRSRSKAILRIGLPGGLQNAIFAIANLFIQVGVNSFDATMVAGNSAATNQDPIVYDVMAAFYTACGSFIGQNYGARRKDRIKKSFLISLAYSFGAGVLLGLGILAAGPRFLSLFTAEPAVVEAGMHRLRVMSLSYGISAFMDCPIAASRGLGKSLAPTVIVLLGSCAFRILWVYTVFAHFGTITSLYLLYAFSWAITAVAEIWYFLRVYRKEVAQL